ncbi:MAG: hypothetical protein MUC49_01150 [Raineya sp.]|jgi:hypothetical protein|nr:hypothetical protein [Raineya sp.]
MKFRSSQIWLIIGFNILALFNTWHVESCSYWEPDWEIYRFFSPEQPQTQRFKPLYFSWKRFYDEESITKSGIDENLVEWQNYVGNQATQKDLEAIIYKSTQQDWDKIRNYVLLQKPLNDKKWTDNSVVQYWASKKKDAEAVEYLAFAKKCEKYAYQEDAWSETPKDAQAMLSNYSLEAEKRSATAKDPFFKLRYAYQAVRLAHYAYEHKRVITLYDALVEPLKTENVVRYWALAHKAGALQKLGQQGMSAYLFAVVFEKSNAKKVSSFLSCKVYSDADWAKAISLCKNNKEKSTLFFIRGIHPQNLALPEMMAIYNFDSNSDYLDMLLSREINKIEFTLMPEKVSKSGFESGYATSDQIALHKAYIPKLKTFILQYLKTQKDAQKQSLWLMALGYCDYLLGNPQEARKSFAGLNKSNLTPEGQKQIEIFETMVELLELTSLNREQEEKYYQKVKNLNSSALKGLMVATFERLYKKQGEKAKEYLSYNYLDNSLLLYTILEDLLTFANKGNYTAYEKELLAKINPKDPYKVLQETKATMLFVEGKLDEAERLFKEAGIHTVLKGDPTKDELIDCLECKGNKTYTKMGLIQQIKLLEGQAKKGSVDAYLKLGNIYYNTSFFGHSWEAMDYHRSGSVWSSFGFENYMKEYMQTDCSKALEYYKKAMEIADKAGNKELAAKAAFLAAKAEQNALFITDEFKKADRSKGALMPFLNPKYRTQFEILKNKYKTTQFYKRAIKECYYFNVYTNL